MFLNILIIINLIIVLVNFLSWQRNEKIYLDRLKRVKKLNDNLGKMIHNVRLSIDSVDQMRLEANDEYLRLKALFKKLSGEDWEPNDIV